MVRCWRWLFSIKMPISPDVDRPASRPSSLVKQIHYRKALTTACLHFITERRVCGDGRRPTQGIVCSTMRSMCGAGAGCSAISYQSLCSLQEVEVVRMVGQVRCAELVEDALYLCRGFGGGTSKLESLYGERFTGLPRFKEDALPPRPP